MKSLHNISGSLDVFLNLFPVVKNGTILVRAEHISMEVALAPLALSPQVPERLLESPELKQLSEVYALNQFIFGAASWTKELALGDLHPALKAGCQNLCEPSNADHV